MNTASRLVGKNIISRGFVISLMLTRAQLATTIFFLFILTSAISVIYVSNACRSLNAVLSQKQIEKDDMYTERNKLLLEKSTFIMQQRIQHIAENDLQMVYPAVTKIKVVHAKVNK